MTLKQNPHEKSVTNVLKQFFGEDKVFPSPYKSKQEREFCDILVIQIIVNIKHFLIFQLKDRGKDNELGTDKYIKDIYTPEERWGHIKNSIFGAPPKDGKRTKGAKEQLEECIEYLIKGGIIYKDESRQSPLNTPNQSDCQYHYFIIIDGYTDHQVNITETKNGMEMDGGVALALNYNNIDDLSKPAAKLPIFIKNDILNYDIKANNKSLPDTILKELKIAQSTNFYQDNIDNEFILDIKTLVTSTNRLIHILDKESWDYEDAQLKKTNIFEAFFAISEEFIAYLQNKERWLLKCIAENKKVLIDGERSLLSYYILMNEDSKNNFPFSAEDVYNEFYQWEGFFLMLEQKGTFRRPNLSAIQKAKLEIDTRKQYNDNDLIRIYPAFDDLLQLWIDLKRKIYNK